MLYEGDKYERTEKGIRINLSKARQKWGMVILEGVKEGSFLVKGEDGGLKPLISEPGNPGFTEGWEDLLLKQAPDVIEAMAAHIFDGHTVVVQQEEFYPEKNS